MKSKEKQFAFDVNKSYKNRLKADPFLEIQSRIERGEVTMYSANISVSIIPSAYLEAQHE